MDRSHRSSIDPGMETVRRVGEEVHRGTGDAVLIGTFRPWRQWYLFTLFEVAQARAIRRPTSLQILRH